MSPESKTEKPERIHKILSEYGVASRRESERMIRTGRVTVNGAPAIIGQSARAGYDEIAVDGYPLTQKARLVYLMLNKPRGYVTTMSDDRGRKTVASLVGDAGVRVYPVGRLDMDSEGLLLMTNDGQFANVVAHPSYGKVKTYEIHVRGDAAKALHKLSRPMEIDSHMVQADSVELTGSTANGGVLLVGLNEGRNRQLRKMCAGCGLEVLSLKRLSIGSVKLGDLKIGGWRMLAEEERNSLHENY